MYARGGNMCILNSKQMRCPSRHLCNRDGNWEKMYSFQAIFISYETLSKSPTPPQFNTLGIRHFECSVAQILISLVVVFKCPNPVDTHGKNKLWKRTRIALEYLLSLTYGFKLPTLILPLMSDLRFLGCIN